MLRLINLYSNLFPVWVVLVSIWALFAPQHFLWVLPYIVPGLAIIMLGMGMTLTFDDFRRVATMPKCVGLGVAAQFIIMPALGFTLAWAFALPKEFAVGLILVSCCPGGTASNVVSFLARANVALSVSMTMCSTLLAAIVTPLLTWWLAGYYVDVPFWDMVEKTSRIVLLPVLGGLLLHSFLPAVVKPIMPVFPAISVTAIVLIVAAIVAKQQTILLESGLLLLLVVFLLHAFAFILGYVASRLAGVDEQSCRTTSIEVGMQNSGLGAALANQELKFLPAASAPCAVSAIMHCVLGSILAGWWRNHPVDSSTTGEDGENASTNDDEPPPQSTEV